MPRKESYAASAVPPFDSAIHCAMSCTSSSILPSCVHVASHVDCLCCSRLSVELVLAATCFVVACRSDFARCRIELSAARLTVLAAAHALDKHGNKKARNQIAAAKVYAPNVVLKVLDAAVQVVLLMIRPRTGSELSLLWCLSA